MSKIFLCCLILSSSQLNCEGQTDTGQYDRHVIMIGAGTFSSVQLMQGVRGGKDGYDATPINAHSGTFSLTYRYYLLQELAIGLAIAYENESGDMEEFLSSTANGGPITRNQGTFKRNVYTISPELFFIYPGSTTPIMFAYFYFGVGYTFQNELGTYSVDYYNSHYNNGINSLGNNRQISNNRSHFNGQVCPVGISFGKKIRGFAELGFGYKGIFSGGIMMQL